MPHPEGEKEASSSCSEESSFTVADQEQTNYTNNGHRHSGPLENAATQQSLSGALRFLFFPTREPLYHAALQCRMNSSS